MTATRMRCVPMQVWLVTRRWVCVACRCVRGHSHHDQERHNHAHRSHPPPPNEGQLAQDAR
eukprot:1925855-Rhodomonas_salina.2